MDTSTITKYYFLDFVQVTYNSYHLCDLFFFGTLKFFTIKWTKKKKEK